MPFPRFEKLSALFFVMHHFFPVGGSIWLWLVVHSFVHRDISVFIYWILEFLRLGTKDRVHSCQFRQSLLKSDLLVIFKINSLKWINTNPLKCTNTNPLKWININSFSCCNFFHFYGTPLPNLCFGAVQIIRDTLGRVNKILRELWFKCFWKEKAMAKWAI